MQEKIIEIPFNKQDFIDSNKLIWEYSAKKFIKTRTIYTILCIIIIWQSFWTGNQKSILFEFGIGCHFYIGMSWMGFFERRIRFNKRVKNYLDNKSDNNAGCKIKFSDDWFEYEDEEKLYKLKWSLFKQPIVYKDYIFMLQKDTLPVTFAIGKREIGVETYNELLDILKPKPIN